MPHSLFSTCRVHCFQHAAFTVFNMPRSLFSTCRVHCFQHAAFTVFNMPRSLFSTCRVHCFQHAAFTVFNMPRSLFSTCRVHCFQHAAFTVFLRDGEGPHAGVRRGFCRALWKDADKKNGIQMFCKLDEVNFPRTNTIVCHSPCAVFCPHAQFLQSLDTCKWLRYRKESSTKVHIRKFTSKTSSKPPQAQS